MEHEEKKELLEKIQMLIENRTNKIQLSLQLIGQKVDFIKDQTTKTNGRVTVVEEGISELENKSEKHYFACPNNQHIRNIQDTLLSRKTIRNWLLASVGIATGILSLYFLVMKFLN